MGAGGDGKEIASFRVVCLGFSVPFSLFFFFVALFWNREWFNTITGIWGLLILVEDIRPQNN